MNLDRRPQRPTQVNSGVGVTSQRTRPKKALFEAVRAPCSNTSRINMATDLLFAEPSAVAPAVGAIFVCSRSRRGRTSDFGHRQAWAPDRHRCARISPTGPDRRCTRSGLVVIAAKSMNPLCLSGIARGLFWGFLRGLVPRCRKTQSVDEEERFLRGEAAGDRGERLPSRLRRR